MRFALNLFFILIPMLANAQQSSEIRTISAEMLQRPTAVFSHAVISDNFVFVSGQAGVDFSTGKMNPDFDKQARQAFENLRSVLTASGSDMAHVVKIVVWLTRAEDFGKLNALWKEFFPHNPPARSVPVVALPVEGALLSIEATAVVK